MSIEAGIINFANVSLPITCMMLFDPLLVLHSGSECSINCCAMMMETPKCNYRNTAPCRVHDMPDTIYTYNGSSPAHVLFCKRLSSDVGVKSYNVFDLENANVYSSYDFAIDTDDWVGYNNFLRYGVLQQQLQPNEKLDDANSFLETLKLFFIDFNHFTHVADFELLITRLRAVDKDRVDLILSKPCVVQSNIVVQAVLAFQQFMDIRLTYIEGRHRQVKCLSVICQLKVPTSIESLYFVRDNGKKLLLHLDEDIAEDTAETLCAVRLCRLLYQVYVAPPGCNNEDVALSARSISKSISKELSLAVTNECCHE